MLSILDVMFFVDTESSSLDVRRMIADARREQARADGPRYLLADVDG